MARRSNQKRRRDPNAPKRNQAAWELFFSEHREEVQVLFQKKRNYFNTSVVF
jgi:hypothetical protein